MEPNDPDDDATVDVNYTPAPFIDELNEDRTDA